MKDVALRKRCLVPGGAAWRIPATAAVEAGGGGADDPRAGDQGCDRQEGQERPCAFWELGSQSSRPSRA
eukprot:4056263-Lingulodinium_polyedra.AAC.1